MEINLTIGEAFGDLFKPASHKAFYGGRGSGKTEAVTEYLVVSAMTNHEVIICARQFQASLDLSSKGAIEQKVKQLGLTRYFWFGKTQTVCKPTGSSFHYMGLDRNPDSARSIAGVTKTWVEEARNISQVSIDTLIPSVLRGPESEIVWTWNPVSSEDPIEKLFRGKHPPPNSIIKKTTWRDNPYFAKTKLPEQMESMRENDEAKYKHIWEGEYYDANRLIFQNVTIADIPVPETAVPQFGLDFGMQSDPNVLIKLYVFGDIVYIARELFVASDLKTLSKELDKIPEIRNFGIVADASWPQSIAHLRSEGFPVFAAKKAPNSILSGISWLQGKQIVISPYCREMAEEARLYSWKVDKYTNRVLNIPDDTNNHGWDAIRYATEQNREGRDGGVSVSTVGFRK